MTAAFVGGQARDHDSYLYVIEIGNDRIKVGRSTTPEQRLASHIAAARAHGLTPGRRWISRRGRGWPANETLLISFCRSHSDDPTNYGEYFAGVPFEVAVAYARNLPHTDAATQAAARADDAFQERQARLRDRELLHQIRQQRATGGSVEFLTAAEVATRLEIPVGRVYAACHSGALRHRRLSGSIFIPAKAVDELTKAAS